MKTMVIDYVRQAIEQTLAEEHEKYPNKYFGGENQVKLFSFYEQLQEEYEVNRYTEVYRDLVNQQNRTGLIMNGTIVAPENPQIMNTHNHLIVPLTFTTMFRVMLKDRDMAIDTIDHLFNVLKGRKQDIAELDTGELFEVGTIANDINGTPSAKSGDFIGTINSSSLSASVESILTTLTSAGITCEKVNGTYYYAQSGTQLVCVQYDLANTTWKLVESGELVPPSHTSFTKYKLSISFDSIRIDQPNTLNANEYIAISFGGSATVVDGSVALGNQLTKVGIKKYKVQAQTDISITDTYHYLEPLEMPSGLGISGEISQLVSNNFIQNKHNDGINPSINYSFVLDFSETLIKQWFLYARYGIQGTVGNTFSDGVSPNMLYKIQETWSSWGSVEIFEFVAKATENIDIENTESDALTLKVQFEIQKE